MIYTGIAHAARLKCSVLPPQAGHSHHPDGRHPEGRHRERHGGSAGGAGEGDGFCFILLEFDHASQSTCAQSSILHLLTCLYLLHYA